jgi:F420-0:gamma-glutamyl ligase
MERTLNSPGKSVLYARKQIQKHSFLKRVAQLVKQSAYAFLAMFAKNVWNTRSHTMSALASGVDSPNVSVAV